MSYTIDFFRRSSDLCSVKDIRRHRKQLAEAAEQEIEISIENSSLSGSQKTEVRQIVSELCALDPYLRSEVSVQGEDGGWWVSSDDDRCRIPYIELSYAKGMISFSYGADASIFDRIRPVLKVFDRHGYVGFDPQVDDILQPEYSASERAGGFQNTFNAVVTEMEHRGEIVIGMTKKSPKPWWRFW